MKGNVSDLKGEKKCCEIEGNCFMKGNVSVLKGERSGLKGRNWEEEEKTCKRTGRLSKSRVLK